MHCYYHCYYCYYFYITTTTVVIITVIVVVFIAEVSTTQTVSMCTYAVTTPGRSRTCVMCVVWPLSAMAVWPLTPRMKVMGKRERQTDKQGEREKQIVFVSWLLNIPATCSLTCSHSPRVTGYVPQYKKSHMDTNTETRSHQRNWDHVQGWRHGSVSPSPT